MFERDSIKFKLILVTSSIILVLMCVLLAFQLFSSLALEKEVQASSVQMLEELSQEQSSRLVEHMEADIFFYIDTMAQTLSTDLYDLNQYSLEDKARKFLRHSAICSVSVIDAITRSPIVQMQAESRHDCVERSVAIIHNGERIGRLDVGYTFAELEAIAQASRHQLEETRQRLHDDIATATNRSLLIQTAIYIVAALVLLNLIALQINKSIIRPIYALMLDMQRLNRDETATPHLREGRYDNDELGKLSRYFYDHIATLINQLNKRANYDDLTLLLSRQRLIYDISSGSDFDLAVLDIDRFKEINNLLGIEVGDALLRSTSELLTSFFAPHAYSVYRLNADEFAVLARPDGDRQGFEQRVREFVQVFAKRELIVRNEPIRLSISAGIAAGCDPAPMVSATTALKFAKEKRIKVARFDRDLSNIKEYQHNLRMTAVIRAAIENDLVVPFYQPIQCLSDGVVTKYEALMRIRDRGGMTYEPAEFLELSKRSGAYQDLSARLIRKSVASFCDRRAVLSVNVSIIDIESEGFISFVDALARDYGIMDRLIFEITEQERVSNPEALRAFIATVKRQGARIALDDFGCGYSNFEGLIHLDIDFLKIDGSLIRNILVDPSSELVVETIVSFARKLGIRTIAEFVGSQEMHDKVRGMGVDFAQGYFVGMPSSVAEPGGCLCLMEAGRS